MHQLREGYALVYTEYLSYVVIQTTGNPGYDSDGAFATVNAQTGVYTYTFKTKLPNGYNPSKEWIDPDVIGIDLGMMLLNVENARNGFIHKLTGSHPAIRRGFQRLGFKKEPGSNAGPLQVK